MSWTGWLIFFLVLQVVHALGTWKMYVAAGRKAWEAFVPVYNAVIFMKILNRPWWYVFLLFLPVVNLIMFIVVWVEALRSFGYNKAKDTVLVIVTLGLYLYFINYTQPLNYIENRSLHPRTSAGEWTSSILFAVIAATIVHTYVMQPFIIPSPSLEKTLLTGDFLFVSKMHYGPRIPMTPVALPMVHDTIPVLHVKSYLETPQIPYTRIPGFSKIKRNDIVVFNWPADTLYGFPSIDNLHHDKPIDKKSNYVKRCVAIAGDLFSIVDGKVHIDGQPTVLPERARLQHTYKSVTTPQPIDPAMLKKEYDITDAVGHYYDTENDNAPTLAVSAATVEAAAALQANPNILDLNKRIDKKGSWDPAIFPYDSKIANNNDNFGPVLIPQKDVTVEINYNNIGYYKRIIEVYEGSEMNIINTIAVNGKSVLLNGKPLNAYTFKQNYYWLMGDNRHNSYDSRGWGFVPENHVVGKPVFVWMSMDWSGSFPSLRFDRMFTTVNGSGQPTSYLWILIVGLLGYFGYKKFIKKKSNK
ncbi:signal peptidase I [Nonlabens ulvanivorans]|uniref:Signal peptidase I n=3 Tax=Nonlabens ulvanivorans TaxID=906888 RepID=A0A084JWK4_NONUL|nr:signal peptidase I [Nonlabens ulvanivorans]KEZ93338.1 signal peptidase I [Nonlabens ulvanivorans]PRX13534.1 signal peptidase I [Nonlabens ulvanivorans]